MTPSLEPLPEYKQQLIVVGTSCRKPLEILQPHLESLARQELPAGYRIRPAYVPDFVQGQDLAYKYLAKWVNERNGELVAGIPATQPDFSDAPQFDSHQWGTSAMARVGENKNRIIRRALELRADYVLFCDSDLILDTTAVASLLAVDKPIVTGVYWTRWSKRTTETRRIFAGPQVWLRNPYELSGRGMDEAEFRQKLLSRGVTRVWGFGAFTLVKRAVFEAGVDFSYLPDVKLEGLMAGEDRHFCIKAERLHIEAVADSWPDCYHIYHADEDVPRIPEMVARLAAPHPTRARLGDLVSLRLRPLEPLQVGPGRFQHAGPTIARGRLGQLALAPEIEEAVYQMDRGGRRIVRCHFPLHYPLPALRGRTRLIEVSLIDCKEFSVPPNLENELIVPRESRRIIDAAALNDAQLESLAEVSA